MQKIAHTYSKCLIICNIHEGRDHVELTVIGAVPRTLEILNKYLMNKSVSRIYMCVYTISYICYVILIYITN